MTIEELSALSDAELREKAKIMKRSEILHALVIGLMAGVVIYSVVANSWGFFTLIPLFFISRLLRQSDEYKALKSVLAERKLD
ncbi:MAG: FUSC family protein [Bacteroidota bacterium]